MRYLGWLFIITSANISKNANEAVYILPDNFNFLGRTKEE